MLDAFIIEKIRREQEQSRQRQRLPLLPGGPLPPQPHLEQRPDDEQEVERDGGAVIVDFSI